MEKERDSSFELIRLLAQFFIVFYHLFLFFVYPVTEKPLHRAIWLPLHIGVILFILISGYFGIKSSIKGFIKLIGMMGILYIPLAVVEFLIFGGSNRNIIKIVFFVSATPFWFMRTYIYLYLFAPVINLYLRNSTLLKRLYLIAILGFICLYIGNLGFDSQLLEGKNLPTFLFLYAIGDTLHRYQYIWSRVHAPTYGIAFLVINLCLVSIFSICSGRLCDIIYYRVFFAYCSIGLLISSILFFLWIGSYKIKSHFINFIAQSSLAIYMIHAQNLIFFIILGPIVSYIMNRTNNELVLFGSIFLLTFIVVCSCIIIYIILIPVWRLIDKLGTKIQNSLYCKLPQITSKIATKISIIIS